MKYNSEKFKARILLTVGLVMVAGSFIIARYLQLPDIARGSIIGVGLALEVLGLGMMQRRKSSCVR